MDITERYHIENMVPVHIAYQERLDKKLKSNWCGQTGQEKLSGTRKHKIHSSKSLDYVQMTIKSHEPQWTEKRKTKGPKKFWGVTHKTKSQTAVDSNISVTSEHILVGIHYGKQKGKPWKQPYFQQEDYSPQLMSCKTPFPVLRPCH